MSTEPERVVEGSNSSRIELGSDQMSETLDDPLSSQDHELEAKRDGDEHEGCVTVAPGSESLASAGDHGIEKINKFTDLEKPTESVNAELDLGIGTQNVDAETNESEKKFLVDSQEVMAVKGEKYSELLVDKNVEVDMVSSHGTDVSDVKDSDVRVGSEDISSGKQGTKVDNLDVECFGGLKQHESRDESILDDDDNDNDNDNAPVTVMLKLSGSDLVWAKVRSHPWWPGQVFDASAATDKAKKYFKKGSFLVTYFGDCSFAWNDASRIKPFRQNFSQMAKQSTLPDFLDAIDFALDEVSRRIEFGLACSCISEEVYQKIEAQNVINPGISEDSSIVHGGDKVSSAIFFEPAYLVKYMKGLALFPNYYATDELQFVSHRAQLLAFNRWKGYSDLPEFETLQGSVESAPKISPADEKSSLYEVKVSVPEPEKTEKVYTKRRKTEDKDDCKQVFEYEDTTVLKKKEKTLAEFIAEKRLSRSNGNKSREKSGIKPQSEKKRKVVYSKLPKSTKKIKVNLQIEDPGSPVSAKNDGKCAGDTITPKKARSSFGIGASILRVANQMHSSTPTGLITCSNSTSKMVVAKNNGSRKSPQERPKAKALSEREISPSPNETLSSPDSTKTPSGKPNSISVDHHQSGELEQIIKDAPGSNPVEDSVLESRDLIVHEDMKEAAGEVTVKDSDIAGKKISGSDLKDQPSNNGSDSCKEDVSAE